VVVFRIFKEFDGDSPQAANEVPAPAAPPPSSHQFALPSHLLSKDMSRVICRDCARVARQNFEGIIHKSVSALTRSSKSCPFCAYIVDGIGKEDIEYVIERAEISRFLPVAIRQSKSGNDPGSTPSVVNSYEVTIGRVPRASSRRYEMNICTNIGTSAL
jgi:hypothetical protein